MLFTAYCIILDHVPWVQSLNLWKHLSLTNVPLHHLHQSDTHLSELTFCRLFYKTSSSLKHLTDVDGEIERVRKTMFIYKSVCVCLYTRWDTIPGDGSGCWLSWWWRHAVVQVISQQHEAGAPGTALRVWVTTACTPCVSASLWPTSATYKIKEAEKMDIYCDVTSVTCKFSIILRSLIVRLIIFQLKETSCTR